MKKFILAAMSALAILFSANAQCPECPTAAPKCCTDTTAITPCCKEGKNVDAPCCKEGKKADAPCCKEGKKAECKVEKKDVCCKAEAACDKKAKGKAKADCKNAATMEINPCEVPADACPSKGKGANVMRIKCPTDTVTAISSETLLNN